MSVESLCVLFIFFFYASEFRVRFFSLSLLRNDQCSGWYDDSRRMSSVSRRSDVSAGQRWPVSMKKMKQGPDEDEGGKKRKIELLQVPRIPRG